MPQIHLRAEPGDYAPLVLLPGDPGRATMIAGLFDGGIDNAKLVTQHRSLLGYTGTYNGKPVSVQTSGMGTPSFSIVMEELLMLGVKDFIRAGTCGGIGRGLKTGDMVIATAAVPSDGATRTYLHGDAFAPAADFDLTRALVDAARAKGFNPGLGVVQSVDVFYNTDSDYVTKMRNRGILAVEMEASALFYLAMREQGKRNKVRAACVLTVSDTLEREDEAVGADYMSLDDLEAAAAHDRGSTGGWHVPVVIPIGINPTTINVSSEWWIKAARDAEAAGFKGVWSWDHFVSRGHKSDPVLECWTTLTAAAAHTSRIHVGSFINNVMNRHPAVLARMLATLWDQSGGRVELGIGVGGSGTELPSYGIALPEPKERSAILEEAVAVIRLLWAGGPADYQGRFFQLHEAYAHPAPEPPPRIIVGGEKPAGARLAARVGDGWTTNAADYETLLPIHLEELSAHGRSRAQVAHVIAVSLDKDVALDRQPLIADMASFLGEWQRKGADEVLVSWVKPADLLALLEAGSRAGLASSA